MKNNSAANLIVKIYVFMFLFIFFMAFISSLGDSEISVYPFDYVRLTDVDYTATLVDSPGSKGKVVVKEILTFDVHAFSKLNLFWELWRDLPEDYIDGVKISYKVNSVKQILPNGSKIDYDESRKLYWEDEDYTDTYRGLGPRKWYHSEGPYDEEAGDYECLMLYVDGLYREQVKFEIEYEMYNAALRYGDCSELYICMYSEETINHLNSFKGQILIKDEDMPAKGNYYAHTYGTNNNDFPFSLSKTKNPGYHTFYFDLDKDDLKFRPYNEYIEFSLVSFNDDKHIFSEFASVNRYYRDDVLEEIEDEQKIYENAPAVAKTTKIAVLAFCLAGSVALVIFTSTSDKRIRKKYTFYEPTMIKMNYFRDIPSNLDPIFAATFAFAKSKKKDKLQDGYSSVILSLARKDYIELQKIDETKPWKSYNVKIVINSDKIQEQLAYEAALRDYEACLQAAESMASYEEQLDVLPPVVPEKPVKPAFTLEPLTLNERYYFNLIGRHAKGLDISMKELQDRVSKDYENTDTFVRNVENSRINIGVKNRYFQKSDYEQPKQKLKSQGTLLVVIGILISTLVNIISYSTCLDLAFGGFFILGLTAILCGFYIRKIANKYILLTQLGEDEYIKWHGLYNFLNSETLMKERTIVELPMWEQYLVYATAFGISDKVIKALKIRCPEAEISSSAILSNPYYRTVNFYTTGRSFRTATRSASSIARSSGGYGGHGGYGGGGRGGGGGGGGH